MCNKRRLQHIEIHLCFKFVVLAIFRIAPVDSQKQMFLLLSVGSRGFNAHRIVNDSISPLTSAFSFSSLHVLPSSTSFLASQSFCDSSLLCPNPSLVQTLVKHPQPFDSLCACRVFLSGIYDTFLTSSPFLVLKTLSFVLFQKIMKRFFYSTYTMTLLLYSLKSQGEGR